MVESKGPSGFKSIAYGLITFSLPLILSGILQQLYNWGRRLHRGKCGGRAGVGGGRGDHHRHQLLSYGDHRVYPGAFDLGRAKIRRGPYGFRAPSAVNIFRDAWRVFCDPRCGGDLVDFPDFAPSPYHAGYGAAGGSVFADHFSGHSLFGGLQCLFRRTPWNGGQPRPLSGSSDFLRCECSLRSLFCRRSALGRVGGCHCNGCFPGP